MFIVESNCLSTSCRNHSNRFNDFNKSEYVNEIKLPDIPPYNLTLLKTIQELSKSKVLFNITNLIKNHYFSLVQSLWSKRK